MGAIKLIVYKTKNNNINIEYLKSFKNILNRGPDYTTYITYSTADFNNLNALESKKIDEYLSKDEIYNYSQYNFVFGYHRLCINDTSFNAMQPFEDPIRHRFAKYNDLRIRPKRKLICNGEIYNYNSLLTEYSFTDKDLQSCCDVEIILPMYIRELQNHNNTPENALTCVLNKLKGDFAFVIGENLDTFSLENLNLFVCRDFLGIKPLYYIFDTTTELFIFVSEMKAIPSYILTNSNYIINLVPPGTFWSFNTKKFIKYYDLNNNNTLYESTEPDSLSQIYQNINNIITQSVLDRFNINQDFETGILLSGGFDSCIIANILLQYISVNSINFDFTKLHFFTLGDTLTTDDTDPVFAKNFISFLENKYNVVLNHHVVYVNNIEILSDQNTLEQIIYILETFDPNTIRNSIPYYYLFKYIKMNTNVKVLLSGEGLQELCGNSLYNNFNDSEYKNLNIKILSNMQNFSLLRIDKISSFFSLEVRLPYLEKELVEYIMTLHPKLKRPNYYNNNMDPIEKYIIRKSFDNDLNYENLWRIHSGISDSFTNFKLRLSNYFNNIINDDEFDTFITYLYNCNTNQNILTFPRTKEEMFYRKIFRKYYENRDDILPFFSDQLYCV